MVEKKTLNFIEEVKELFGENIIVDDNISIRDTVIPTGSLSLDISTGAGGIPLGKFTEIYGPESSGKTTLALSICKSALTKGKRVLYLDAETTLPYYYINSVIGDYDKDLFKLLQPGSMEQALKIAEIGIVKEEFDIIVLDSIGSMSPEKVQEDELTDSNVALLSRIMTKFVQRNAVKVKDSNVAFIGINQVRDKIGAYISSFETPGGHAWKHILSLRIQLSKAEDIKIPKDGKEEVIGINTRFTIRKNKLAAPLKSFFIPIMFGKGIDSTRDIIQFAEVLGVLTKTKGAHYSFESTPIGHGIAKTEEFLNEHQETLDKIVEMCYTVIKEK